MSVLLSCSDVLLGLLPCFLCLLGWQGKTEGLVEEVFFVLFFFSGVLQQNVHGDLVKSSVSKGFRSEKQ